MFNQVIKCLAPGYNAVPTMSLKPATIRSQVKHSITEALRCPITVIYVMNVKMETRLEEPSFTLPLHGEGAL